MRFGIRVARRLFKQYRSLFLLPPGGLLLFLALLWTVIAIRLSDDKADALANAQASAQVLATSLAQHTATMVHDVDLLGRVIKFDYERDPEDFHLENLLRSGLITPENAVQVSIVGPDGRIMESSTPFSGNVDLDDRKHFTIHQTDPNVGLFISEPVFGRISHQWTIQMTRRLNGPSGAFNGVVVVSEAPNIFTDGFFNTASLGARGMVSVLTNQGTILSRRTAKGSFTSTGTYDHQALTTSRESYGIAIDPIDGFRRIVASAPVDGYDLVAVIGLSEDDVLDDLAEGRVLYLSIGVVGSLFLICFFTSAIIVLTRFAQRSDENRTRSETDPLTKLPNRYKATADLTAAIIQESSLGRLALFAIDLNGFKYINDAHGHDIGDFVLQQIGFELRDAIGKQGTVYRVGGDEFAVIACGKRADVTASAERLIRALDRRMVLMGEYYRFPASAGIAFLETPQEKATDLLRKADLAMYAAKDAARGHSLSLYRFYDDAMNEKVLKGVEIVQAIGYAMQREEFRFSYVPVVHAESRRQALIKVVPRWQHPLLGDIDPYPQLRDANSPALTERVDNHLLEAALHELKQHGRGFVSNVYFSFSHSSSVLALTTFPQSIAYLITEFQIAAGTLYLEFDLDAPLLMQHDVRSAIASLKAQGVVVITTGLEMNLALWVEKNEAVPDGVHLNPSFWAPENGNHGIVKGLVEVARSLDFIVIASSVIDEAQIACLSPYDKAYFTAPSAADQMPFNKPLLS